MCRAGGRRCELSNELTNVRKRVRRTSAYQNADGRKQEKIIKQAERDFKNQNKELVQKHAPETMPWQTNTQRFPKSRMKRYQNLFEPPKTLSKEESDALQKQMYDEYKSIADSDAQDALAAYSLYGFELVNKTLRTGKINGALKKGDDLQRLTEIFNKNLALLDKVTQQESETPRTLYRHHIVPAGWSPREYAEKYFPIGSTISDSAFLSTTEDPAYIAGHFAARKGSNYVVYQIVSRKGVSVVRDEKERHGSVQSFEKERLLPRDSRFRVVGHKREKITVSEEREEIHKQFMNTPFYFKDLIPDRSVTIIQLLDENEIS